MGELTIVSAIEKLSSSTSKERADGLADLKRILEHNRRSPSIEAIKDKGYHEIYEAVFGVVSVERSAYLKATSKTKKESGEKKLSLCADVLRLAVSLGLRKLYVKTIHALVDHIIQVLPIPGEGYCQPLCQNYIKCLRAVLGYQPHVEHLRKEAWNDAVDFCTNAIRLHEESPNGESNVQTNGRSIPQTPDASVDHSSRSGTRQSGSRASAANHANIDANELVLCLRQLTCATNAPILNKAESILTTLIGFLRTAKPGWAGGPDAFACINDVLARTTLDSAVVTQQALLELIPLIKDLWSTKQARIHEEMLITLINSKAHIASLATASGANDFKNDLESLVEALHNEYAKRAERDQLQLQDIFMQSESISLEKLQWLKCRAFRLRTGSTRSESQWVMLYMISFFASILDVLNAEDSLTDYQNGDEGPRKRLRRSQHLQDCLRQTASPQSSMKIAALQILTFMLQLAPVNGEEMQAILDTLTVYVTDGNGTLSSWASLAITSCAFQKVSAGAVFRPSWLTIWRLASRNVATTSTCRAACHLMDMIIKLQLVRYSEVFQSVEAILASVEVYGPAIFAESSSSLLATLLRLKAAEDPGTSSDATERVMHWLFARWAPRNLGDRAYSLQHSQHHNVSDILRVVYACTDRQWLPLPPFPVVIAGPLARAWHYNLNHQKLINYLLLLDEDHHLQETSNDMGADMTNSLHFAQRAHALDGRILDFCITEIGKVYDIWKEWTVDRPQHISGDMIRIATALCIIGASVAELQGIQTVRRVESLRKQVDTLTRAVTAFASRQECEQDKVDGLLEVVAAVLPDITHLKSIGASEFTNAGMFYLATHLSRALDDRGRLRDSIYNEDMMDLDDDFDSQTSHGRSNEKHDSIPRGELAAMTDITTLRSSVAAYVYLISASLEDIMDDEENAAVPRLFIKHLVSLPESELLACRPLVVGIMSGTMQLAQGDAEELLRCIGEMFLGRYEFERCEAAIITCLDIIIGSAALWTDPDISSLHEVGEDLYQWFITVVLEGGIASPNVETRITDLLLTLLRVQPDYGQGTSLPSVRTSLFGILQEGDIPVKYHVAERISDIFRLFILSKHDAIFDDVHGSLPKEPNWKEGMAIRVLVLSRLASTWHTLLRRCVYHIFEAAGMIQESTGYAARCVTEVSATLMLKNSKALFRIFSPQLLYTWLGEGQSLVTIPYAMFNYASLAELLEDVKDETLGQVMMRGNESDIAILAEQLSTSPEQLLKEVFAKPAAYSISWDTCVGSSQDKSTPSREARVRDLLGKELYMQLVQQQFPHMLGLFFLTLEQDEQIERAFAKRPSCDYAAASLKDMKDLSSSTDILPAGQQPSFKARYLLDQIDRLCRRLASDPLTIWTPELYVYVLRMLLDAIHPALGWLHACSVIRKIRVLVSMAKDAATCGYALEMTLHALRPFLTNHLCADDTFGIVRFLFEHGKLYLLTNLPFVAGISISTLISLRSFLGSSQESTTQETQHRATMTKAESFRSWFTTYLKTLQSRGQEDPLSTAFLSLVHSASNIRGKGNAIEGTSESHLLRELLDDERSGRELLREPARRLAFDLLCNDFQPPPLEPVDVLGSDESAARYAVQVWRSCQRSDTNQAYLAWAARVLGRTYCARGNLQTQLPKAIDNAPEITGSMQLQSSESILRILTDLLQSDDREEAGLAEEALRWVIASSTSDKHSVELEAGLPEAIVRALSLRTYVAPSEKRVLELGTVRQNACAMEGKPYKEWIRDLTIALTRSVSENPFLVSLPRILYYVEGLPQKIFPYVLHSVLTLQLDGQTVVRQAISEACALYFRHSDDAVIPHSKVLINAILYLRTQPVPTEVTQADRDRWLDLDYAVAAQAAATCGMFMTALLFAEIYASQSARVSRRSSVMEPISLPAHLLLRIYRNVPDQDYYYGVQQDPTLTSVLDRLDFEGDGYRSLLFHGARLDSQVRLLNKTSPTDSMGAIHSMIALNLNSLTHTLMSHERLDSTGNTAADSMFQTARKLEQWDIRVPESTTTEATTIYKAFQAVNNAANLKAVRKHLDDCFHETIRSMIDPSLHNRSVEPSLRVLAVLTEMDEVFSSTGADQLHEMWTKFQLRQRWMYKSQLDDFRSILSCRETIFSLLSSNKTLQDFLRVNTRDSRTLEVQALLASSNVARKHGALQESLAKATYLNDLVPLCRDAGLEIEAAAHYEVASVLWEQGEISTSIRMLQELGANVNFKGQSNAIGRPTLLAQLGHHIAEARLEKPDEILTHYLIPAIKDLKDQRLNSEAGQVYHEFATFCDRQLQNPDSMEDFNRMQKLRERRVAEVEAYADLTKNAKSKQEKEAHNRDYKRAKKWCEIDNHEYQRLRSAREAFVQQSLENYLLTLQACDDHDDNVLRFFALWLEYSETALANTAVEKHLSGVPSHKFAVLMNQLSSRLQAEKSGFQKLLHNLVYRICVDHPYHGMHHIYAGQMPYGVKDEAAKSRHTAAKDISLQLKADKRAGRYWQGIQISNNCYHNLAIAKEKGEWETGREYPLDKHAASRKMMQSVPGLKVPPATMNIKLRSDRDYSGVPRIVGFKPRLRIANGLSCPKILTAMASDGRPYKQLLKGGNDDLRQDAIMEQVFEQASKLLKNHTATRQRNLQVRTYKVLPLSAVSGIMEFVQNTMALHDYLMPAHERYYPKDLKASQCRKKIHDVSGESAEVRVKTFRSIIERFTPVMQHFFFERFLDPDDWFEKRLAYTRSTAAISILGHILGLGDRHCHNILLDEKSGEVVHIDLGVAFEAGRVLPVPEVVPFRLTRDLVDAMGYTKTEGVFRRCCEFTLEALRDERESIMTLLNVLRYDPLYSWSVSPLKAKRMQEQQDEELAPGLDEVAEQASKRKEDEAGEAGRALAVVEKKLSKTLSTAATVNELIQQATDERNLALLYSGWAAYA